jgi:hypothetical protein
MEADLSAIPKIVTWQENDGWHWRVEQFGRTIIVSGTPFFNEMPAIIAAQRSLRNLRKSPSIYPQ